MAKVAVIAGATGIVGSLIIEQLIKNTSKADWSKIIAISRRKPELEKEDARFVHLPIDLTSSEEEIAKKVRLALIYEILSDAISLNTIAMY